jgi:hypothetical protein
MRRLVAMLGICLALIAIGSIRAEAEIFRTSDVSTVVMDNGNGTWTYDYTVRNISPAPQFILRSDRTTPCEGLSEVCAEVWPTIIDFEVPLGSLSDAFDIRSPEFWDYEVLSAAEYEGRFGPNPFGAPFILHWFDTDVGVTKAIVPTGYNDRFEDDEYEPSTNGFILTSRLPPVDGPYLTSWFDEFRNIGDPPLPGGSNVGGGGTLYALRLPCPPDIPNCNQPDVIPEPSTILLLGAGLVGLGLWGRKRMRG